jgi:hypothetical protein
VANEYPLSEEFRLPWQKLQGCLVPFYALDGSPVPLVLPGNSSFFIPCFDDDDKLREMLKVTKITGYEIKQITDPEEFVFQVTQSGMRIMYNPHIVEGHTRWTEIILD